MTIKQMKAAVLTNYDKNGRKLEIQEVEKPSPREKEVLVKIFTAAVNHVRIQYAYAVFGAPREYVLRISGELATGLFVRIYSFLCCFSLLSADSVSYERKIEEWKMEHTTNIMKNKVSIAAL